MLPEEDTSNPPSDFFTGDPEAANLAWSVMTEDQRRITHLISAITKKLEVLDTVVVSEETKPVKKRKSKKVDT
jgi:hypothetical protein